MLETRQAAVLLIVAKARASARRDHNAVHKAADKHLSAMTIAVAYAFGKGRKAVSKTALKAARTHEEALEAMNSVPAAVRSALEQSLPPVILACLVTGGDAGLSLLPRRRSAMRVLKSYDIRFDVKSPEAIAWAKEHAGELAKDLSETTLEDIRDAISSALEGEGIESAYDDILAAIGDSDRAEMIARTETMNAANEGLAQSWDQAIEKGLLTGDEKKVWIATSDCCDECDELDGEEVGLNEDFSAGDDPPLHPNCRCTMGLAE